MSKRRARQKRQQSKFKRDPWKGKNMKANDQLNKAQPKDRNAAPGVTAADAAKLLGNTQAAGAKAPARPGAKDQPMNSGRVQEHTNIVRGKRDE